MIQLKRSQRRCSIILDNNKSHSVVSWKSKNTMRKGAFYIVVGSNDKKEWYKIYSTQTIGVYLDGDYEVALKDAQFIYIRVLYVGFDISELKIT